MTYEGNEAAEGCDATPDWHVVPGDWRLAGEAEREGLMQRVGDLIEATALRARSGEGVVSRWRPSFLGDDSAEGESSHCVYEVRLPAWCIGGRNLTRWCYFLWDGRGDAIAFDGFWNPMESAGSSSGFWLGPAGSVEPRRVAEYIRLGLASACAADVAGGSWSPSLVVDGDWPAPSKSAQQALATRPHGADDACRTAARFEPIECRLVAEGEAWDCGFSDWYPPGTRLHWQGTVLQGATARRVHLRIGLDPHDEAGRWSAIRAWDDTTEAAEGSTPAGIHVPRPREGQPLIYSWLQGASLEPVSLSPSDFIEAMRQSPLAGAAESEEGRELVETRVGRALQVRLLRELGLPPSRPALRVAGDLDVRQWVEATAGPIDVDLPVVVEGSLILDGGTFRHQVALTGWEVQRLLTARSARFEAGLRLSACTILDRHAKTGGGPAVALDGVHVSGALEIDQLMAAGLLSLDGATIEGHARITSTVLELPSGMRTGGFSARGARITGDLRLEKVQSEEPITLETIDVGGTLTVHASGACMRWKPVADVLTIAGAIVGRDVSIGGATWVYGSDGQARAEPVLVGGNLVLRGIRVRGSLQVTGVKIGGGLDASSARVGGNVTIGCSEGRTEDGPATWSSLACATVIGGSLLLEQARVGGSVALSGTCVAGHVDLDGLRATWLLAVPRQDAWMPLGVLGDDGHGVSIKAFGTRVASVRLEGAQVAGAIASVGMRVAHRILLRPSRAPRGVADAPALHAAALSLNGKVRGMAVAELDAAARELAKGVPPTAAESEYRPSSIMGGLRLRELKCGGNVELWGTTLGRSGKVGASLVLRNATIGGDLLLREPSSLKGSRQNGASADEAPDASVLAGGVSVDAGTILGRIEMSGATIGGDVGIRHATVHGGIAAVGAGLGGNRLEITGVRSHADLDMSGLEAARCHIADTQVGGSVLMKVGARNDVTSARLGELAIVGCTIDGSLDLHDLSVDGAIDLSDTSARRGLQLGSPSEGSATAPGGKP